jgi:histidyl-tRNA synthetase
MQFTRPRGTRDFLPDEVEKRRYVEEVMRRTFERFGYREIQTPVFEKLELITAKSGEDIRERLYHFKDKSGRDLALRPELTAPVMRLYVNELQVKPKPLKLYYFGNCFRYERPQAGRYREFWQAGVELIGTGYPEADAEVIALAVEALKNLGLKEFETHVGHIGILRKILEENGIGEVDQNIVMGVIDKGEEEALVTLLETLGLSKESKGLILDILKLVGGEEVMQKARKMLKGKTEALEELRKLEDVLEILKSFKVDCKINLGIARGLDYYTGVVFEIYSEKLGAQKQICGGGSYTLAEVFGGEPVPTSGFSYGFDRVLLALKAEKVPLGERKKTEYLIVPTSHELLPKAIEISRRLRKGSPCEIDLMRRRLGKALAYADSKGIPFVIIVGDEELKRGKVVLKDMKTGEQEEVGLEEIGR